MPAQNVNEILGCNSPLSPGELINLTDPYELEEIKESVCIITNKVFAACQQRACFKNVVVDLPDHKCTFQSIKFGNGIIVNGTEKRTPIPSRPNFSRVRFVLRVPFTVKCIDCNGKKTTVNGFLDDILKDIVMFIPQTRDEFDLDLVVETRSELLGSVTVSEDKLTFNVGVFIVVKIVGKVQLLIPAFGYCPEPIECEEFIEPVEEDICLIFKDFNLTPFPEDFFPPQLEDLECNP